MCLLHSCNCIFSVVLVCAVIFYFAYRSRSAFKFDSNSNRVANYKSFGNEKGFLFSLVALGRIFFSPPEWPSSRPLSFSPVRPNLRPS
jgi:hypothetical protein